MQGNKTEGVQETSHKNIVVKVYNDLKRIAENRLQYIAMIRKLQHQHFSLINLMIKTMINTENQLSSPGKKGELIGNCCS